MRRPGRLFVLTIAHGATATLSGNGVPFRDRNCYESVGSGSQR